MADAAIARWCREFSCEVLPPRVASSSVRTVFASRPIGAVGERTLPRRGRPALTSGESLCATRPSGTFAALPPQNPRRHRHAWKKTDRDRRSPPPLPGALSRIPGVVCSASSLSPPPQKPFGRPPPLRLPSRAGLAGDRGRRRSRPCAPGASVRRRASPAAVDARDLSADRAARRVVPRVLAAGLHRRGRRAIAAPSAARSRAPCPVRRDGRAGQRVPRPLHCRGAGHVGGRRWPPPPAPGEGQARVRSARTHVPRWRSGAPSSSARLQECSGARHVLR